MISQNTNNDIAMQDGLWAWSGSIGIARIAPASDAHATLADRNTYHATFTMTEGALPNSLGPDMFLSIMDR